jgi:predicted porin
MIFLQRGARLCALAVGAFLLSASFFTSSVFAANVGGDCCADLEERVAELEATTVRKGNRSVSLQVYGQVNRALLIWDDGFDKDAYVVDNDTSSTRVGLIGEAQMKPGWLTGYRVELEFKDSASNEVFNGGDEGSTTDPELRIRHSYWYIESEKLGRVSVGQQSPATDDITIINLGAQMSDAALHYNNNFGLWLNLAFGLVTDLTWADFAHSVDTLRGDFVRYDSPSIYGFVLSAAAGEDDVWDVALRYRADWNSMRFAAGVGYMDSNEHDFSDVRGSASAMHMPTGLYLSVAGGVRDDMSGVVGSGDGASFYFAQLGVKRQFLPCGPTTIYAEFGKYQDYTVGRILAAGLMDDPGYADWGRVTDSEVRRWGVGVEQSFDAAATVLYAQYHHYEGDLAGIPLGATEVQSLPVEPWEAVVLGARVQF